MTNKKSLSIFAKEKNSFIVALVCFIWILVGALGLLQKFDYRLYDLMLALKKEPQQRKEVLFVEIDNQSLEALGAWPWSRDILAESLLRMKELGAASAVFDIEYLSPSNLGVAPDAAQKLGAAFDSQKKDISEVIFELSGAVESGFVTKKDVKEVAAEMVSDYINPGIDNLFNSIEDAVYRDNDRFFASALQFFGNAWLTINVVDIEIKTDQQDTDYVVERCLFNNVEDPKDLVFRDNLFYEKDQGNKLGFSPALPIFMRRARGAGFTNVVLDVDGTRRRVELLAKREGSYVAQLVFAPLLKQINPEKIVRNFRSLSLVGVQLPGEEHKKTVRIPLDENGRMLISWQHKEFKESFRHESVYFLHQLNEMEKNIVALLGNLASFQLWDSQGNPLPYFTLANELLEADREISRARASLLDRCLGFDSDGTPVEGGLSDEDYDQYFAMKTAFFEGARELAAGTYHQQIVDRLNEMKDELYEDQLAETLSDLDDLFDTLGHEVAQYLESHQTLTESYRGSFCIIGNTASSTTDLGNTPFNRAYPNVGTHANVYNTILNQDFITPFNWLWGAVIITLVVLIGTTFSKGKSVFMQNLTGLSVIALSIGLPLVLIAVAGIYIPIISPALISISVFLVLTILNFVNSDKDKKFLRSAFSTYLAPAVVEQIVKNPEKLKLGGDEKVMTALFSDIRSFSTFSEKVTPTMLVSCLNEYLGAMSDCILEEGGTIDKYIGDAIVSFFNAPIDLPNHAYSACLSAVRMKQAEAVYNKAHFDTGEIPMPLQTRVGINTGDMVVGNMGTSTKMNYTMMGDNVNLASRLEGVNKAYESWIMCSESTWAQADSGEYRGLLVARKFDRVRVVGKNEPVQLFNILGVRSELDKSIVEAAEIFNQATDLYLAGEFEKARSLYEKARETTSDKTDGTPNVFIDRCNQFIKARKKGEWDGVYQMTDKGHD